MNVAVSVAGLLLLVVLAGCAAPAPLPALRQQAVALNQLGLQHFGAGRYAQAERQFAAALQLERAAEHEEGIAQNLLNLAHCALRQGQPAAAIPWLQELAADSGWQPSAAHRAEAQLLLALLALQRGDAATAAQWHRAARDACGSCSVAGKLAVFEARLALQNGLAAEALVLARQAQQSVGSDVVEQANALRLQGSAQLQLGQRAAAQAVLQRALALDKAAALPPKIFQDLVLLGHAHQADAAQQYWHRARRVAHAAGMAAAVAEVDALLAELAAGEPVQGGGK
ncbi:tetratricopeptide repeat protein [Pseudoduganella sp. OTU4001]|uniref:tetratricopeptide repeat protein n=1 Tax=Pseudoduganella sp. OTU4001 TaxID=3043854 RepID=UPI00313CEA7C